MTKLYLTIVLLIHRVNFFIKNSVVTVKNNGLIFSYNIYTKELLIVSEVLLSGVKTKVEVNKFIEIAKNKNIIINNFLEQYLFFINDKEVIKDLRNLVYSIAKSRGLYRVAMYLIGKYTHLEKYKYLRESFYKLMDIFSEQRYIYVLN